MRLNEDFFNNNIVDIKTKKDEAVVQMQNQRPLIDILGDYDMWLSIAVNLKNIVTGVYSSEAEKKTKQRKNMFLLFKKIHNILEAFPYDIDISSFIIGSRNSPTDKITVRSWVRYNDYIMNQTGDDKGFDTINGVIHAYIGIRYNETLDYIKEYNIISRVEKIIFSLSNLYYIKLLWRDSEEIINSITLDDSVYGEHLIDHIILAIDQLKYDKERCSQMSMFIDMFSALCRKPDNPDNKLEPTELADLFLDYLGRMINKPWFETRYNTMLRNLLKKENIILNEDFFNDNHLELDNIDNKEPAIDNSIVQWQAGRALIDIFSDYNLWIDMSVDMRSFVIRSNRYEEERNKILKIIYKEFEKIMNVLEAVPYDVQISPCVLGYTESEYSYRKIAKNHYETYNDYKMYQTENTENGEYLRAYIGLKCSGEVNYLKAYYIINRIQNILFQSKLVYSITLLWKNKDSERIEDVLLLQQKHIEDMLIESIYNLIMEYSDEYMKTLRDMFAALYGLSKNDAKKTGLDYLKKIFMDYMDKRGITYK